MAWGPWSSFHLLLRKRTLTGSRGASATPISRETPHHPTPEKEHQHKVRDLTMCSHSASPRAGAPSSIFRRGWLGGPAAHIADRTFGHCSRWAHCDMGTRNPTGRWPHHVPIPAPGSMPGTQQRFGKGLLGKHTRPQSTDFRTRRARVRVLSSDCDGGKSLHLPGLGLLPCEAKVTVVT